MVVLMLAKAAMWWVLIFQAVELDWNVIYNYLLPQAVELDWNVVGSLWEDW
jgi:hypothetical protein